MKQSSTKQAKSHLNLLFTWALLSCSSWRNRVVMNMWRICVRIWVKFVLRHRWACSLASRMLCTIIALYIQSNPSWISSTIRQLHVAVLFYLYMCVSPHNIIELESDSFASYVMSHGTHMVLARRYLEMLAMIPCTSNSLVDIRFHTQWITQLCVDKQVMNTKELPRTIHEH